MGLLRGLFRARGEPQDRTSGSAYSFFLGVMTNDRRFPKKYRFTVVNRLQDLVIDIFQHIQEANELDLSDPQEFRERRYEQKKALTKCKTVLFLIEISFENNLISKEQCETWTNYVVEVKRMAASWRKKDRERVTTQRRNAPPY